MEFRERAEALEIQLKGAKQKADTAQVRADQADAKFKEASDALHERDNVITDLRVCKKNSSSGFYRV